MQSLALRFHYLLSAAKRCVTGLSFNPTAALAVEIGEGVRGGVLHRDKVVGM